MLLFFLSSEGDDLPPAMAALRVFSAYTPASKLEERRRDGKDKDKDTRPDTTVYHAAEVTDVNGVLDPVDSGSLAALRDLVLGDVGTVLAQTPGGRFVIAKSPPAEEGELYGVTGRRDASLTDAERVVREFALQRPQFTS